MVIEKVLFNLLAFTLFLILFLFPPYFANRQNKARSFAKDLALFIKHTNGKNDCRYKIEE